MHCLVIKTSSLGDIVQSYPAVQYLRRCHPDSVIDWVVEAPCADLVASHPSVDHCICIDTKSWRRRPLALSTWREIAASRKALRSKTYDLVVDLQGNVKSAVIATLARSCCKVGFAASYVSERPNTWVMHRHITPPDGMNVRDDYLYLMKEACHGKDPAPIPTIRAEELPPVALKVSDEQRAANLLLHEQMKRHREPTALLFAGSAWKNKQLDELVLARFLAMAEEQLAIRWLLAWGSPPERDGAHRLSAALNHAVVIERRALPQLQHLMGLVDLVVSMDSLPLHLAATTGVATYSIFGPSSASKYAPVGERHHSFQGPCPYGRFFPRRCPILRSCATGACLHSHVTAEILYSHFSSWWSPFFSSK